MRHWEGIVPCGLAGREVASVETLRDAQGLPPLDAEALMQRTATAVAGHFEEVFAAHLREPCENDLTLARHKAMTEVTMAVNTVSSPAS